MRLLKIKEGKEISLTEDILQNVPPYAILSHTWGEDEVTYEDICSTNGGRSKLGYKKILFCETRAKRDGLKYFWIDTCCINKSNSSELNEAIVSMFRWYRNSAKCYVYLEDVPSSNALWLQNFENSRWFRRGWTLQELLAPQVVEFFTRDNMLLGTKSTLELHIAKITKIKRSALRGVDLGTFSVKERLSWTEFRQTTREEDNAYCLLGLFGISMVPIYGEGAKCAFDRLKEKIRATDPEGTQYRAAVAAWLSPFSFSRIHEAIQQADGTCEWIFELDNWKAWTASATSAALWIYGEPGVGKTVLTSTATKKIMPVSNGEAALAYFYCDASNSGRHEVENVIALLTKQLLMHLKQPVPGKVGEMFENARQSGEVKAPPTLKQLCDALQLLHRCYSSVTYVLDGLDECFEDERRLLLDTILPFLQCDASITKLLLSSRNKSDIASRLGRFPHIAVDATMNSRDIQRFIKLELFEAIDKKRLLGGHVSNVLLLDIESRLNQDASGMFLWVKLQISALCKAASEKRLRRMLDSYPKVLDKQYDRMMELIHSQDSETVTLAKEILRWMAFSIRPCSPKELWCILASSKIITGFDFEDLNSDLALEICHNFLQLDTRGENLLLVHTSARQYLKEFFGDADSHANLASQCARYLATCGFDQRVENLSKDNVDTDEELSTDEEPQTPPERKTELDETLWTIVKNIYYGTKVFKPLPDEYPFLSYAGNYWLQHADIGSVGFDLKAFPWIMDENSSVFEAWRALNGIQGGFVLDVLGPRRLNQIEKEGLNRQKPNIVTISAHLGLHNLLFKVFTISEGSEQKSSALVSAASAGMDEIVAALVNDKDVLRDSDVELALLFAASSNHTTSVILILKAAQKRENRMEPDFIEGCVFAATVGACLSPEVDTIKEIYALCGNRNQRIHEADMVKTLAKMISAVKHLGLNVVRTVEGFNYTVTRFGWTPLMIASTIGNELMVPILLHNDPRLSYSQESALVIATSCSHNGFVEALIRLTPATLPRSEALVEAIQTENEDMIKLLTRDISPLKVALLSIQCEAGPESNEVDSLRHQVRTAVGEVAALGNTSIMDYLISQGFSLHVQDDQGKTALHRAVENDHKDMVKYLLEHMSTETVRELDANHRTAQDIAKLRGFNEISTTIHKALGADSQGHSEKKRKR